LYAVATSIIYDSSFKEFTPLLLGVFLGAGNLFIAKELGRVQKDNPSFFIKVPLILSILIAILWFTRGILSHRYEIVLAQDQNILNISFFAIVLMLIFIRKVSWIGFYLDNSIHYQKRLEKYNGDLLALVEEVKEVEGVAQSLEHGMLNVLNQLAKERDNETGNHVLRTQLFVRLIASHLDDIGKSEVNYTKENLNILFKAAPLHDIGKVGIPDSILLKPGKLDPAEWEIMKTHSVIGERILSSMNVDGEISSKIIKVAIEIAGSHHENWDGTGYPRGLSGKNIPQSARIMALADVYDALLSSRPYKKAWTYKATSEYINSLRGTKFDPDIVDAFNDLEAQFRLIRRQFKED
jgi:response regulator RpfG family c-di-GMP phosphodiesterase